ncbi:MFS transporter [Bacillus sp. JJ722]|uniref:MFS transporter n=1 Tax=Bacillus sp. JJ722 TaxID=3122973 RepID=UPI002FFDB42B
MKLYKELLRNKAFIQLIIAQVFSSLADWFFFIIAIMFASITLSASSMEISAIMLAFLLPQMFLSPFSGWCGDRYNRKLILICSELGRGLTVCLLLFTNSLLHLGLIMFMLSIFSSFFVPAKNGKLKENLTEKELQAGVAFSGLIDNGSKILGPSIAGVLISNLGTTNLIISNVIIYMVSAFLLCFLAADLKRDVSEISTNNEKWITLYVSGFREIKSKQLVFIGLFSLSIGMFFLQMIDSQLAILFKQNINEPEKFFGYALAAAGLGTICATLFYSRHKIISFLRTFTIGCFILGISIILVLFFITQVSESMSIFLLPVSFFIAGSSFGAIMISFQILVQKQIANSMIGRVFGAITGISTAATIMGVISGGLIAEMVGLNLTFLISGALLIIFSIFIYVFNRKNEREVYNAKGIRGA